MLSLAPPHAVYVKKRPVTAENNWPRHRVKVTSSVSPFSLLTEPK